MYWGSHVPHPIKHPGSGWWILQDAVGSITVCSQGNKCHVHGRSPPGGDRADAVDPGTGRLGCWSQFLWVQGPMEPDCRLCPAQPTCLGTHPKDMGLTAVNSRLCGLTARDRTDAPARTSWVRSHQLSRSRAVAWGLAPYTL